MIKYASRTLCSQSKRLLRPTRHIEVAVFFILVDWHKQTGEMDLSDLLSSMAPSGDDDVEVVTARREWKLRRKVTALSYSSAIAISG